MTAPDVETERQRVIAELDLANAQREPQFDDLVMLANQICGTRMAAFTVLSPERQWLKARAGLEVESTDRAVAFCNAAVAQSKVFEVPDARLDEAFASNPLVTAAPGVRFYAGVPVGLPGTPPVGALCVLDTTPRHLSSAQRDGLEALGREVSAQLALRQHMTAERKARASVQHQLEHADRLAVVGQLAAALAHELGTPLAIVSGRARMLAGLPSEQVQQNSRIIVEQSERMAHFIRQLLDFARRREPRKAAYDVRVVARQAVSLLGPMATTRGVALDWVEPPAQLVSHVDASQLGQVLTNIMVNALHATPRGGRVAVAAKASERFIDVSVTDTGHGIAPADLPRLFDPFFTRKETGEGTGLGLSIAAKLVRDHGGHIDVESELGHGACFTVHLPR